MLKEALKTQYWYPCFFFFFSGFLCFIINFERPNFVKIKVCLFFSKIKKVSLFLSFAYKKFQKNKNSTNSKKIKNYSKNSLSHPI